MTHNTYREPRGTPRYVSDERREPFKETEGTFRKIRRKPIKWDVTLKV